jgi:hypothetical protein
MNQENQQIKANKIVYVIFTNTKKLMLHTRTQLLVRSTNSKTNRKRVGNKKIQYFFYSSTQIVLLCVNEDRT